MFGFHSKIGQKIPHTYDAPHNRHPGPEWYIRYSWWTTLAHPSQSPYSQKGSLRVSYILRAPTKVPSNTLQNSSTALTLLCVVPIYLSFPQPWKLQIFSVSLKFTLQRMSDNQSYSVCPSQTGFLH